MSAQRIFTDTQIIRLTHFFENTVATKACQICDLSNWQLYDGFFSLGRLQKVEGGYAQSITQAIPLIAFQCNECGQVITFNATIAGVWGDDE